MERQIRAEKERQMRAEEEEKRKIEEMNKQLDTERRIASLREASARDEDEHCEKMIQEQEVLLSARYSEADSQISDLKNAYTDKHMEAVDAAFEMLMSSPSKSKSSDESTSLNEKQNRKVWQAGMLLDRLDSTIGMMEEEKDGSITIQSNDW